MVYLTPSQKQDITNDINQILLRSQYSSFLLDQNEIMDAVPQGIIQCRNEHRNPLHRIFSQLMGDRKSTVSSDVFYHFKTCPSVILDIINKKSIQVSNMVANTENDYTEYSEFFRRIGFADKNRLEKARSNTFILCFANTCSEQRMWDEYATNETGVCLCFNVKHLSHIDSWSYSFRNVFYDHGYDLDVVGEIVDKIEQKYQLSFLPQGVHRFAQYYKRDRYRWENETRLSIQYEDILDYEAITNTESIVTKHFTRNTASNGREYLDIPFQNPLFEFEMRELIMGKNVSIINAQAYEQAVNNAASSVKITRR